MTVTELTFILPEGLKDVLFEQKKIKVWNKWHFFVKWNWDYAACLKSAINYVVA